MIEALKKNPFTDEIFLEKNKPETKRASVVQSPIDPPIVHQQPTPPIPLPPIPTLPPVQRAVAPVPLSPGSDESHLVSEYVLTGCEVACRRCLGRWYVERVFSDGDVSLSCYSCRGSVTGELFPGLADDRRTEKRREREAEDAAIAAIAGDATT